MKVTFLAVLIGALSATASAQTTYQCVSNGNLYTSYQPCPRSGMLHRGPVNTPAAYEAPMPKIGRAPEFQDRLSPRCAALNDAIRTGPARGLKSETLSDMNREYQQKCSEEESEARNQIRNDQRDKKKQQQESDKLDAKTKELTDLQQQQCDESKRIIHSKRTRTNLTDGEKAEFQRFIDNHHRRCG